MHLRAPWVLFEREDRLGGHARTDERDGYRFDKTGHWLHLRDPGMKQLVGELLPGQMVPVERKARIFSHGALTRYPFQANLYGLPPDVIKECLLGVIEAKLAAARGGAGEPKNFEEYCLRHFGAGISKHFMIPYNERLWGVSPREITAAWCRASCRCRTWTRWWRAPSARGRRSSGYNVSFLYPKEGGIETFTARAADAHGAAAPCTRGPARTPSTGAAARSSRAASACRIGRWSRRSPCPSCSRACPSCRPTSRRRPRACAARRCAI